MESRVSELRRRGRRIFWTSMGTAVAVHAVLLVALFWNPSDGANGSTFGSEGDGTLDVLGLVDIHFGPPEILRADGTRWMEPPDRVLDARSIELLDVWLPEECRQDRLRGLLPATARLRLEVNYRGRVTGARVVAENGEREEEGGREDDSCREGMMIGLAESLWYHWLPDERFPAPIDLIQPMSVEASR